MKPSIRSKSLAPLLIALFAIAAVSAAHASDTTAWSGVSGNRTLRAGETSYNVYLNFSTAVDFHIRDFYFQSCTTVTLQSALPTSILPPPKEAC